MPVERPCAAVRLLGVRVEADELADVAERFPDPRDLLVGQVELGPDLERSAVEAGSLDVGKLLLGPLSRRERVAVRLLAVARVEEVQGEQLGELAAALVLEPLVRLADLRVQLAAPLVREALVRRVAEEGVAEAERAGRVRVAFDELAQAVPSVRVGQRFGIGREHVRDELRAEGGAEHGGVAEQRAVACREPVDARRDDGLDALGQRLFLRSARGRGELLQEQRVAAAAVGDGGDLVLEHALGGRRPDQLP